MFLWRAEAHDLFDPCPVVPRPVEQHDLALCGQVRDVSLEIPFAPFAFGWRRQRGNPGDPRTEVLRDPLDGAAFTCGVAALEYHDDTRTGVPDPLLNFHEFSLQPE